MKKLIKLFLSVVIISLIIIPSAITVSATEERVFDGAGLFSAEDIASLESKIQELKSTYSHDFVIVTTNDAEGKTSRDYADDYFDYNGFGVGGDNSGFLLLIDMDNRDVYISTKGQSINYLTDARLDNTLDILVSNLQNEDYSGAAQSFLDEIASYISAGVPDNQYSYDEDTVNTPPKKAITGTEFTIAFLISLAVGGIFIGVVRHKYGFAGPQIAYPLRENSTLNLTKKEDVFINKTVTFVRIPDPPSGGGGTSTHSSGSGSTHGGGGRGF